MRLPASGFRLASCTALLLLTLTPLPAHSRASRATQAQRAAQPQIDPSLYSQLRWRTIGPQGNRVSAVVGIPGDPNTYYAGAASGGVWKTSDGGINWEPIFDGQPVQSIGSLAIDPSDPSTVWAGSGEACVRSHISLGNGIYKSTDAGNTWTHMGLENTGRIAEVRIDPLDRNTVFACALGHAYGPQQERGVFRTKDGGRTWERVLFVDENTGCSALVMDPSNPRVLLAGLWTIEIRTWGRESGGMNGGIFMTRDGGTTWQRLSGNGLPRPPVGKIGLAIARSNPQRIYAQIETGDGVPWKDYEPQSGELWMSENGGETWVLVSHDRNVMGRAHYYTHMDVAPDDEFETYFLAGSYAVSHDGGRTLQVPSGPSYPGGDNHDIWIDRTNADRMIIGNDGGASITTTRGRSWRHIQLPIAQMYHVTVDNQIPYYVLGNEQDDPSYRGPSNTKSGSTIPRSEWHPVLGGESGWATPDPTDPNIIWSTASGSGSVGGIVVRFDERTRTGHHVEVWPITTGGHPAGEVRYRFIWDAPLHISAHDHNKVYTGSQHVHVTTDGGRSWEVISPDLTLNDRSRMGPSGGLTQDNIGVEYAGTLFSIAESPVQAGIIWAGSNDGLVHVTTDGGRNWTNVTRNITNLPPWGTINAIAPSRYDANTAYIAVDFHQVNGRDPHLYKTTDLGRTWRPIVNGIPKSPLSYTNSIAEDPVRRGLLYAGTENALYVSFNDGELWQPLQNNLPHAPVYDIKVQEHFNDLVLGTYGRGFWILDDITPLRQLTPDVMAQDAYLFAPRAAYRFRARAVQVSMSDDPTVGENPPYGASINYWLKAAPRGPVTIEIQDGSGRTVRTLRPSGQAGSNRVYWDLEGEPTQEARARTKPLYADWVELGRDGTRSMDGVGRMSILMPPGRYTVKLSVAGRELTQPLEVRKDPNSGGSEQEVQAQMPLLNDIYNDVNT
ncbi:MAG: sialidase, partial [Gemmatimonadetes bacterium]|nr:sialidase [Gemmatimonadota bacterium]